MRVGIISDTHDLLRPEAVEALRDCCCILHAGDVSSQRILNELEPIAPLKVVHGNNDKEWAAHLPLFLDFELYGLHIYMTHKKRDFPRDLSPYDLAVYGHSHQYSETWLEPAHNGKRTLLLNPGSCGPRRFHQPITMAVLTINEGGFSVERIDLPHATKETAPKIDPGNIKQQIETVIREVQKGNGVETIANKCGMDKKLVEQIIRLYVTHPGVTADGIMTKMGL